MANQHTKARDMEQDFLKTARKRWDLSNEFWRPIYAEAREDLEFLVGDQWPEDIKKRRELAKEPCLTINRLWPYIHQVTNEQRQNRPAIQVNPVDSGADVKTAEILQGIIRHIEYDSNADSAYTNAFFYASSSSVGFFRILTDYVDNTSFDQTIKIGRIHDPESVRFDPSSREPDGSDANFAFVFEDLTKEEFERQYPSAKGEGGFDWDTWAKDAPGWFEGENVRVAEYFVKEFFTDKLYLMPDGSTKLVSEFTDQEKAAFDAVGESWKNRHTTRTKVQWYKITGTKILEQTEWPDSEAIPIIPVYGDEVYVNGERRLSGVIRFAKDPQRQHNYWQSAGTTMIALAPRAPYVAAEGQLEGYKKQWEQANTANMSVLTYKPIDINGTVVGAPQRNVYEPPIQAISHYLMQSVDDLKATTGIFDPSLGNRENAQSGIAITRLQNQSGTANYHYMDNLSKSLRHAGRILVRLIAKVIDTPRMMRIIGEDGKQSMVQVNAQFEEKPGQLALYDLKTGKYDVTISTGPGYQTQRQEAQAFLERVIQARPDLMTIAGDLVMRMQNNPMAKEIADRIEKTLPENLKPEKEGENPKAQIPPEVQQQLMQAQQMIPAMQQQLQGAAQQLQQLQVENQSLSMQLKNKDTENQIKGMEAASDAQIEQQKLELDAQKLALEAEKLRLESEKLKLEELRIMSEALKPAEAPQMPMGEESEEPEAPEQPQGMTREDLALHFQALLAAMNAPMPPMPPQVVRLAKTPEGVIGTVTEANSEGMTA